MIGNAINELGSPEECQKECHNTQGCGYFNYHGGEDKCELFETVDGLEYNENADTVVGPDIGCHRCYKTGYDYVKTGSGNNLIGYHHMDGVSSIFHCAKICQISSVCFHVRFVKVSLKWFIH